MSAATAPREQVRSEAHTDREAWVWLAQRISGALLVVYLAAHMLATHFLAPPSLNHANVTARLSTFLWQQFDWLLLALVVFHGLNGVRGIVVDYLPGSRGIRLVSWGIALVGVATMAFGGYVLDMLIRGR